MRIDKYDPFSGGFRARLAADFDVANIETPFAVGLDVNGRVVIGGGSSGIVGVLVLTTAMNAGDVVDVMTDGELVEATFDPGTVYFGDPADGVVSDNVDRTVVGSGVRLGHTVEGDRVVVRVAR